MFIMQTHFWYLPKQREWESTYSFSLMNPCEDSTSSDIVTENKVVQRMLEASSWQFKGSSKVTFKCLVLSLWLCQL